MKTKDKEPEQPEIKRYELEIPKADGKNGYYLSKPSVMITHIMAPMEQLCTN